MIYYALQILELLRQVHGEIDGRKPIKKSSQLGKAIPALLRDVEEMMSQR